MSEKRVLLLIMPFLTLRRPHLGVALLKAGLNRKGMDCDVRYFNFRFAELIGAAVYERIAENSPAHQMPGEFVFTPALFGEQVRPFSDFTDSVAGYIRPYPPDLLRQMQRARNLSPLFIQECANQIDLRQYDVVGLSSTFQQNIATLAMAQELKRRAPHIVTVCGGSNFEGEMGIELHRKFPFVDIVCSGEADHVFPELVRRLRANEPLHDLGGITFRENGKTVVSSAQQTFVTNLNDLPYPDHTDFFRDFHASGVHEVVTPEVTMETSRGCWWGQKHHCTFCGLNGLGMTYRSKSPDRAYEEIRYLLATYGNPDLFNTDNIVDMRYFKELFPRLEAEGIQLQLFYETKANLKKSQLWAFRRVGSTQFQPGIESLSSHVLTLMDKGVKGIQNVQLLRWAKEMGLDISWNIICGFPGETPEDYRQIAEWVARIPHLQPPLVVTRFRLDRFSPMFKNPQKYGIVNLRTSPGHRLCYPFEEESLQRIAYFLDCDPPTSPETLSEINMMWSSVGDWKRVHAQSTMIAEVTSSSLTIHDRRFGYPEADYRYDGLARQIYLAADSVHTESALLESVLGHAADDPAESERVHEVLQEFVSRDLMLKEDNFYLSLAVLPLRATGMEVPQPQLAASLA
ncbi:MAG TPA: RiPP maturation radical SAM C-methyltransferase [Candidatus Angelobacter sp.]|nr:RiPP maturation radical SAM C-methyltransferase [Candidatus Angelobacter sp.]